MTQTSHHLCRDAGDIIKFRNTMSPPYQDGLGAAEVVEEALVKNRGVCRSLGIFPALVLSLLSTFAPPPRSQCQSIRRPRHELFQIRVAFPCISLIGRHVNFEDSQSVTTAATAYTMYTELRPNSTRLVTSKGHLY